MLNPEVHTLHWITTNFGCSPREIPHSRGRPHRIHRIYRHCAVLICRTSVKAEAGAMSVSRLVKL